MSDAKSAFASRLSAMKSAFDGSFAEPLERRKEAVEKLLAIRVGSVPYALRLAEIGGVSVGQRLVAAPGPLPELLGLSGVRGRIVPIYSLSLLLGVPASETPRWACLEAKEQLALAFDQMDGYLLVAESELLDSVNGDGAHCPRTLRRGNESLGIISVPSVVRTISERVAAVRPRKEA